MHMMRIRSYKGVKKKMLKTFEHEQWPIADKEHYGNEMPDFRYQKYSIIASEGADILGFIFLTINVGVATIDSLLVHESLRRKGIASSLLKKAEEKAKKEGCHLIRLETGEDWSARKFYEKHGYTVRALLKGYYGKRDFVLMDKGI